MIFNDPELIDKICKHVASGGSAIHLAEIWEINYGALMNWVRDEDSRSAKYDKALLDRKEWAVERILVELNAIAMVDLKSAYNEDMSLKPISEWPKELRAAVKSVEQTELFETSDRVKTQIGWTKKVNLHDKLKALELLAKNHSMLTENVNHSGVVKLEDLVLASYENREKDAT